MQRFHFKFPLNKTLTWTLVFLVLARGVYWFGAYPNSDEAYYWLWGRHLSWSYYDHPPLHAWIQGVFYTLFGQSLGVLRLPTLLSSGLVFYIEYCFVEYLYRDRIEDHWRMTVVCTLVSPLYFVFLMMAWHDQWLVAFSLGSAYAFVRFWDQYLTHTVTGQAAASRWLYLAGATLGLAFLCKYTALFVGLAALGVMGTHRSLWPLFREARLYGAVAIATAATLPIVIWNAHHDWLSFQYYATRSLDDGSMGLSIKPLEVLGFWGLSILLVSPMISFAIFYILSKPPPSLTPSSNSTTYWSMARWLFFVSTGLLSLIGLFSTALYYWNILAYLLLLPALPSFFETRHRPFIIAQGLGCLVAALITINYAVLPLSVMFGSEGDQDGRMLFGWDQVAPRVITLAQAMGNDTLLLTSDYRSASALAYALNNPDVLAISDRKDQFDVWAKSRPLAGKNAVVLADDWYPISPQFEAQFETLSAPVTLSVKRWNIWIKNYYLYEGYGFHP